MVTRPLFLGRIRTGDFPLFLAIDVPDRVAAGVPAFVADSAA